MPYSAGCDTSTVLQVRTSSPVFWLNAIQWAGVCAPRTLLSLSPSLPLSISNIYQILLSDLSPPLSPTIAASVRRSLSLCSMYLSVSVCRSLPLPLTLLLDFKSAFQIAISLMRVFHFYCESTNVCTRVRLRIPSYRTCK